MLGIDTLSGCASGKTCDETGACIAAQCSTSEDCPALNAPICENQICVAKCTSNDECTAFSGRHLCASDGVCVECVDDSQCTAGAARVCDSTARACRGCAQDDECNGGICLESEGTCVLDAAVSFVATSGTDSGTCTRMAPCATIPFVLAKLQPTYKTIHILGGTYSVGSATLAVNSAFYLDGANPIITANASAPVFHYTSSLGGSVLNNVTITPANSPGDNVAILVDSGATLGVHKATINRGIKMSGGTVSITSSIFSDPTIFVHGVDCTNGTVSVAKSTFESSDLFANNCTVSLTRTWVDAVTSPSCFAFVGGKVFVENNVFTAPSELTDCGEVTNALSGSTVQFNTFANTSDLIADGRALYCDNSVTVSSNIFAWGSSAPHGPSSCVAINSLYDAANTQTMGASSFKADGATFFVSKSTKNFHLAAGSPAVGKAQAGLSTTVDFDGNPRPAPMGSVPDVGAYEAP